VPVTDLDTCSQCGSALSADAPHCPNCGKARLAVSRGPSSGVLLLMVLAGIVCGFPLAILGAAAGFSMERFFGGGFQSHAGALATAIYFIAVTLLLLIGLIVVATRRMNALARAFAVAALATALGLFALCDPIMLLGLR
jgi:hypothetical protein